MIPWILIRSIPCHPVKEKGHRVHETVASSAVEQIFNVTAMHAKATERNHLAKANRASHGQRVRAKDIVQKVMENPKENPKVTMVPKVRTRVKHRKKKRIYQVWNTRNPRQVQKLWNLHRRIALTLLTGIILGVMMAGVTMNELNDDWSSVGWHEKAGSKPMAIPQAHFYLDVLILVP